MEKFKLIYIILIKILIFKLILFIVKIEIFMIIKLEFS